MLDCEPLATPLVSNLKLYVDLESNLAYPSMYRQLIGSFIYLVNTKHDICFVLNTLRQFMVEPR